MPDPVFEHGFVQLRLPGAANHDHRVDDAGRTCKPKHRCHGGPSRPRRAENRRVEQYDAEVDDRRGGKSVDLMLTGARLGVRYERHHHELEAGQRSSGRSDNYVKVFPEGKRLVYGHGWELTLADPLSPESSSRLTAE